MYNKIKIARSLEVDKWKCNNIRFIYYMGSSKTSSEVTLIIKDAYSKL